MMGPWLLLYFLFQLILVGLSSFCETAVTKIYTSARANNYSSNPPVSQVFRARDCFVNGKPRFDGVEMTFRKEERETSVYGMALLIFSINFVNSVFEGVVVQLFRPAMKLPKNLKLFFDLGLTILEPWKIEV